MNTAEKLPNPIVSVEWLSEHLEHPNLILLDATIPKPGSKEKYIPTEVIGTAQFFDINNAFSDKSSSLPHTMPSVAQFEEEAQKLGINQDSWVVVYDALGTYSSPRAWWMFKAMGFSNVSVLDGGLPTWKAKNFPTKSYEKNEAKGDFKAVLKEELIKDKNAVLTALEDEAKSILDARSAGRFDGTAPEPRVGLRSGHMPNAKSLPFTDLQLEGQMKTKEDLKSIFNDKKVEQEMIFSCGSGVTACILALGATIAGYDKLSVYDGSWSEWGQEELDLPVVK
ncbi:3-mercaptopyruvate sulfurtransferase [Sediminitomix flava]|uniref:Thiosulfate/3-mercaptopyruvate sulfurtransferase n=1 Tax=Sediminitomix flava TaxID=379075 RepID=A0A315Z0W4_SEDFL|nr:3-mercaptopyruvate sulfurtransferase [Sediminitomix flava]PWJ36151.1 thiosulfate/3-mercaptopyruvate sulfurtransferase [Sediminitomix flava]